MDGDIRPELEAHGDDDVAARAGEVDGAIRVRTGRKQAILGPRLGIHVEGCPGHERLGDDSVWVGGDIWAGQVDDCWDAVDHDVPDAAYGRGVETRNVRAVDYLGVTEHPHIFAEGGGGGDKAETCHGGHDGQGSEETHIFCGFYLLRHGGPMFVSGTR